MANNFSVPPILYHYTKWKNFEKIVQNHTWRFSSINFTNDIKEKLNGYVIEILNDRYLINNLDQNIKDDIIHNINTDNYLGIKNFFIACFSEKEDDPYMWENEYGYGDKGQGVCIGINSEFFTEHLFRNDDKADPNASNKLGWTEIAYDIQTQKQRLLQIAEEYEKYDDDFIEDNTQDLAYKIRNIAMTMKDKAFKDENEYRLVIAAIDDELLDDNFLPMNTNKEIYYDLNSNAREGFGELFHSILIGKNSQYTEDDVKKLLNKNGFNTSNIIISKSKNKF